MAKTKDKVLKTFHISVRNAKIVDDYGLKLTKTVHGRSAVLNEMINFTVANMANFEAWWDNRGDKE
jgi:hypothetical protein